MAPPAAAAIAGRRVLASALLVALSVALTGCGGDKGTSSRVSVPCGESLTRRQCSACACEGRSGKCTGPVRCTACRPPYAWNATSAPGEAVPDGECAVSCPESLPKPSAPRNALDLNGVEWPQACFNGMKEQHFFVIGDWGGVFGSPPQTFQNRVPLVPEIDHVAQLLVAGRMADVAQGSRPKFILNVGDNFYPGGISAPGTCNATTGHTDSAGLIVFEGVFEKIYKGDGLDGVEWWGVLGNHDYGGYYYNVHWDQNVFYTWHGGATSRWLTPALYWSRRVQYRDFAADFFFVDTNRVDAGGSPDVDPEHNPCSRRHNSVPPLKPDELVCPGTSLSGPDSCWHWFTQLWAEQKEWLAQKLERSHAEWQIIVTHYPPTFEPCRSEAWEAFFPRYGVDLYVSGHTHLQQLAYRDPVFGDTAYIISGGGGGITSEGLPDKGGQDDQYGFMDLIINKDHIQVIQYSHGGTEGALVVRNRTTISPRPRSQEAGDAQELVF